MHRTLLLTMHLQETREFDGWLFGWQGQLGIQSWKEHWSRAHLSALAVKSLYHTLSALEEQGHLFCGCLYYTYFLSKYNVVVPPFMSIKFAKHWKISPFIYAPCAWQVLITHAAGSWLWKSDEYPLSRRDNVTHDSRALLFFQPYPFPWK